MAWRPSFDQGLSRESPNEIWRALEGLYDAAVSTAPLPRRDVDALQAAYISLRRGQRPGDETAMLGRVPASLRESALGLTEIEVLDLLVNYRGARIITLRGPRGAGKTSLLHYVEAICERSRFPLAPVIVEFNGLALSEADGDQDFVRLFRLALEEQSRQTEDFADRFSVVAGALTSGTSLGHIRDAMSAALRPLDERTRNRIVVAFDNLDHLKVKTITRVLQLAKLVSIGAGIACVVSLRPQCFEGQIRQGSAGALYAYRVDVPAPQISAWLDRLASRLGERADLLNGSSGWTALDDEAVGLSVRKTVDRFSALLKRRRSEDDVLGILQTVAADDTRTLAQLVRNVFSNRNLPVAALRGEIDLTQAAFHPLPALFEGSRSLYRDSHLVPNLLWMDCPDDSPKLLICQRVLQLLGDGRPMQTKALFRQMRLLGYVEEHIDIALARLTSTLLIRGTDVEVYAPNNRASSIYLTEAGAYYRNHLLANADYVLSAVLDVPLEHSELRRVQVRSREGSDVAVDFVVALKSLVEYAAEARKTETNQIYRLLKHPSTPDLRRVAFALRKGGLMIRSLRDALLSLQDRGQYSNSPRVKEVLSELPAVIESLSRAVSSLESRLDDTEHKRSTSVPPMPADPRSLGEELVTLHYQADAEGVALSVRVDAPGPESPMLIGLIPSADASGAQPPQATVAYMGFEDSLSSADAASHGSFQLRAPSVTLKPDSGGQVPHVSVQAVRLTDSSSKRIALLSPALADSKLILRLNTPSSVHRRLDNHDVGQPVDFRVLCDLGLQMTKRVGSCTSQKLAEELLIQGTRLAEVTLSAPGKNTVSSLLDFVDTLVVFVAETDLSIPWEWLRPTPQSPMLCQKWNVIRWPASPIDAIYRIDEALSGIRAAPLKTFGLGEAPAPWRASCEPSLAALNSTCVGAATVHLVGHYDPIEAEMVIEQQSGQLRVGRHGVAAIQPVPDCTNVILSGCEVGAETEARNIAVLLAQRYGCSVWTPLVAVDRSDVEQLDRDLALYLDGTTEPTLEQFFRRRNETRGLSAVYARYGFGQRAEVTAT